MTTAIDLKLNACERAVLYDILDRPHLFKPHRHDPIIGPTLDQLIRRGLLLPRHPVLTFQGRVALGR